VHLNRIAPIYPLTEGLPQRWLRSLVWRVLEQFESAIEEPRPELQVAGRTIIVEAPILGEMREQRTKRVMPVGRRSSGASLENGSAGASPCQNSPRIGTPTGAHEILFKCLTQSPCCGVLSRL